ncbi:hypothetical protein [Devosia sp. RR2S18]|uniref:hypothetical protein n=1 Tax=Devosia rhizosphaerae TaxID=3049774 RepID=UPI002540F953|nr:hypothetical protein [Devosia sp. RR2S18]WIJ26119.1 hypothetical protein QOV41_04965 [Devosia sp. RR2S18]
MIPVLTRYLRVPGTAIVLFLAFLSLIGPAHANEQQGQRDCANLRLAVMQFVGEWSKAMLFASRDMDRNGWLDANVANSAFKDMQIAVMQFDYAYEDVPKARLACRDLALRSGMDVAIYIDDVTATGKRPARGITGW